MDDLLTHRPGSAESVELCTAGFAEEGGTAVKRTVDAVVEEHR